MTAGVRLLVLGAWFGLAVGFAALLAAPAFTVLPGTDLAARLVGVSLDRLDILGMALGVVAVVLGVIATRGRGGLATLRAWLPLLGAGIHALSYFWVTPEIQAIRESAGGSIGELAAGDPRIERFGWLHELSVRSVTAAGIVPLLTGLWDSAALLASSWRGPATQPLEK